MITKENIVGEWKLQDFIIESNGEIRPWKNNAHGLLIYTESGYMSVSINGEIETEKSFSDKFKSILFYSAKYRIEEDNIIHEVINASDVNRIGKQLIRTAFQEKDKLILIGKGEFGVATLTWKKIDYRLEFLKKSDKSPLEACTTSSFKLF